MRSRASVPVKLARGAGWLLLPLGAALLVVLDPFLSRLFPTDAWLELGLAQAPIRFTPMTVVIVACALQVIRVAGQAASFAALALILLLVASQLNGLGAGPLDIFDLTLFGLFLAWLARMGTDATRTVPLSPLLFYAMALVLLAIAHLPVLNPVNWFVGMIGIVRVAILVFLIVDLCRDRSTLDLALKALVGVATASAIIGIAQFTLAYFGLFYFTLIEPPVSAFKPTPLGFVMRASGLCITAQHFSSFLVYALPVALWSATTTPSWSRIGFCVVILAGIGVSLNFGGIFTALLELSLFPFLRWPSRAIHYGLALLTLVSLAYFTGLLQIVYDLSFGDAGVAKGVDQRKTLFILGIEQVAESPLVGTGLRGFGDVDGNFWGRPVHNLFGQAASELGLLAPLIMGAVFVHLSLGLGRLLAESPFHRAAGILLLMMGAALLLAQSEPNLDQSNLWLVLSLAQVVVLIARRGGGPHR